MILKRSIWLNSVTALLAVGIGTYSVICLVHALWTTSPSCDDKAIVSRIAEEIGARYDPRDILNENDGLSVLLLPYLEHLPHRVKIVSIWQASMDENSRLCELDGHLYFDDEVARETMRLAKEDPFIMLPTDGEQRVRSFESFSTLLKAGYQARLSYRVLYGNSRTPDYKIINTDNRLDTAK